MRPPAHAEMRPFSAARLKVAAGIDFHLGLTLLLRSWGIVAGAVIVLAIPSTLTPQQQGYYFTFASLLGLQIFFELGLNQVVVQIVSHEMANLVLSKSGSLSGPTEHVDRLKSIVSLLRKWYAFAAVLFAFVTALTGAFLFDRTGTLARASWLGPWLVLVVMTAINLYFSPMLAVREGCGNVGQVARLRLIQSIVGNVLSWVALFSGAGLWAVPLTATIAALFTGYWVLSAKHRLHAFEADQPIAKDRGIDWKSEVFPFQWRVAVSWISGYFLYQLFTPLVFVNLGSVAAGRLGISQAIFNALLTVGVSWINTKIPALTGHVTRGERSQLDQAFFAVLKRSAAFNTGASVLVVLGVFALDMLHFPQVERIADLPTLACLAVITSVTTLIYGAASYMRAHRKEPMLPVSVVCGLLTLVSAYFASRHGTFLTMFVQVGVTVLISLPWTYVLFSRYQRGAEA